MAAATSGGQCEVLARLLADVQTSKEKAENQHAAEKEEAERRNAVELAKLRAELHATRAQLDGPLRTGRMFCACPHCLLLDFDSCERTSQVGRVRAVTVPLPRGSTARVAQIASLEEWAALLKPGCVVGVRVAKDQLHIEGAVWLLLVDSEAFEMPEDMVHSSDTIEAGWIVVRGRWYEEVQRSPRGYQRQEQSRLILVNTTIRVPGIHFNGGAPGKYPRKPKSGLHILHEDMYNLLDASK